MINQGATGVVYQSLTHPSQSPVYPGARRGGSNLRGRFPVTALALGPLCCLTGLLGVVTSDQTLCTVDQDSSGSYRSHRSLWRLALCSTSSAFPTSFTSDSMVGPVISLLRTLRDAMFFNICICLFCAHACRCAYVEVSGQTVGISSLLPPLDILGVKVKNIDLLSHLACPSLCLNS